jgi:putative protease
MSDPHPNHSSSAETNSESNCGCSTTGLKKAPAWEGLTLASVLPSPAFDPADAPPEPEAPQGEYNPHAPEAPLVVPLNGKPIEHSVELLAPAGGLDAGYAAYYYGADAIYLGMKKFSARAEAENFTFDDIDAITSFAHSLERRRRVFVTVNTLILQHELDELVEALGALSDIGVDALIIQDLGVYGVVRKHFPELELHASTQLAVHNRAGAETLRRMGFTRVVLARELTLEEVGDITATSGVETEVFVHGALCYSYSGLCLFSSQTLGRSGNRGKCAYSCRDEFQVSGAPETLRDGTETRRDPNTGFAFSMKDLALPDHLPALRAAGVSCVKIEGRKKSPLYVATTTDYYRRLLDGTLPPEERPSHEADMKTVFSRPWTRLFVQSHKDKEVADRDTVGHRGNPIGTVAGIAGEGSSTPRVRFTTALGIERHDGLQIDVPGLGKPFGFAVETLRVLDSKERHVNGATVFEAPSGATIEVDLPEEHPPIPLGSPIYCSSSQSVKRRYRHTTPKAGEHRARRDVAISCVLEAEKLRVTACIAPRRSSEAPIEIERALPGPFTPAKDAAKMETAVRSAFEKLGDTRLTLTGFAFSNPTSLFVPVSRMNALRREVTDALEAALNAAATQRLARVRADVVDGAPKSSPQKSAALNWSIKVDRVNFLDAFVRVDWEGIDEVTVDIARDHPTLLLEKLNALQSNIGRERIRLALPALTRKWEEKGIRQKIAQLREAGWLKWEAANASAWSFLEADPRAAGNPGPLDLSTDWSVYVVNRAAALQVLAMGARRFALSPEDGLKNFAPLLREFGAQATVIVYQDTPLFLAESCAYANLIGGCPGKANCRFESMDMVSSHGEKVSAIDYHCRTIVLNKGPFCLSSRLKDLLRAGAASVRADFIYRSYEPAAVRKTWRTLRAGQTVPGGHAANFDSGML